MSRPAEAANGGHTGAERVNFVQKAVRDDNASGRFDGKVVTRFPPEPNAYLHIGHAKAICVSYGIAEEFGGTYNLRFDDTNPAREEAEFVHAIERDIRWLGFDPGEPLFASDYFEQLYRWAEALIERGLAYVDDLSPDEIREYRGTLTEPGRDSPWRDRPAEESLDLFRRMRAGEFEEGSRVLRARIDMRSPHIVMRDPVMYRILRTPHHRTGTDWCVYPMYDWAHGQSDSIEGITHSLCSIEFENHRPLYDWFLDRLGIHHPQQIEFARLALAHTVTSKRKLRALMEAGILNGWDDPRAPTLSAMRRRGFPPEAIRDFCDRVGVARDRNLVDYQLLEFCVREQLNRSAPRVMGVLDPLKVVITNWPDGKVDELDAVNNPEDESAGTRKVPFTGELWIERSDFLEDPPRKFFRLRPDGEVRLRWGYIIRCREAVKDDAGRITELRCTYDPDTRGGHTPDGRKVRGTIHWVSAPHAVAVTVRSYDHLFTEPDPARIDAAGDWKAFVNPESLQVNETALAEPSLTQAPSGTTVQFERQGYYCVDPDSSPERLVVNRTVTLRDSWARIQKKG
ncbi:MAG TPA: glutamine--tRNA ligase/YqeY domain fusion protein [bacterium]|nr:glutamine--tRNA ligase/YqeY domain fusion protein [bacterium]